MAEGPDEVVVDKSTAGKKHLEIGQTIGVQAEGPVQLLTISGIVKFGSVATIGGATLAGFDLPTAQQLFKKRGQLDEIAIAAKPGVSDPELLNAGARDPAADGAGKVGGGAGDEGRARARTRSSPSCAASCSRSAGSPSSSAAS